MCYVNFKWHEMDCCEILRNDTKKLKTFWNALDKLFRNEENQIPTHCYPVTLSVVFSFYQGFLSQALKIHKKVGKERGPSFTIMHLFATVYLRWLPHILYCTACNYQIFIWWDLPRSRITIWLIDDDDGMLVSVCLISSF